MSAAFLLIASLATALVLTTGVGPASANAPTAITGSGHVSAQVGVAGTVTVSLSGKWTWPNMSCTDSWGVGWAVGWQDASTPYTITGTTGDNKDDGTLRTAGSEDSLTPQVTGITPATGSPLGGTMVTITGQHLTDATAVDFGTTPATTVTVVSGTEIKAVAPAVSSTEIVKVTLTTPYGTSGDSPKFRYKGVLEVGRNFDGTDPPQVAGTLCSVTTESNGTGGDQGGSGDHRVLNGTWSSTHTYATATSVPATLCVNFYHLPQQPVATSPTSFAGGPSPYNHDNSLQTGNFNWLIGGNCLLTPPIVTGLSQSSGPATGGTPVTITGTGFKEAAGGSVDFGSTPARTVSVVSNTTITATSPGGAGMVHVTVTDLGGSSPSSSSSRFNYVPVVTGVSPDAGPSLGGTPVTVTGDGFTGVGPGTVHFGSVSATGVTVVSNTELTAVSPAHSLGSGVPTSTVDVTVTNAGAASPTTPSDEYTYISPTMAKGITPDVGPAAGGTTVTITGSGFSGAFAVVFGSTPATSFTVTGTKITAVSPAGTGTETVTVTTTSGSASSPGTFTYAPVVTGLSKSTGPATGGTTVTITGSGFSGTSAVLFGSTPATRFTASSATSITAVVPGGAGAVTVMVTTFAGSSAASAGSAYSYVPVVTSVSPATGPTAGGTRVTITGVGFTGTGTATVLFGSNAATSVVVVSDTTITVLAPSSAAATVTVTVKNAGKLSPSSTGSHFIYVSAPAVAAVSPDVGPAGGGTSVVITGTGFTGAGVIVTAVHFGSASAESFTVTSTTSITATSPAGTGTVSVTVVTSAGSSTGVQYTYAPVVTSLSHSAGPATGGTTVTITGSGFTAATKVTFGSVPATSFSVIGTTSITAVVPGGAGTVHARVTNVAGSSPITAANAYSYVPVVTSVTPDVGAAGGGGLVTIAGVGFTGATAVHFGTAYVTVVPVSDTEITVDAPAVTLPSGALADPVDVTVVAPSGTSPTSASDVFTYLAPAVVTGVSPEMGPTTGNTPVTITGSGFTSQDTIRFGTITVSQFSVGVGGTTITTTAPPGVGIVTVSVSNAAGSVSSGTFSYIPSVSTISQHTGPATGGSTVTITGKGFTSSVVNAVDFDSAPASSYSVKTTTTITALAPGGAGTVDVTVTTIGGSSVPSTGGKFTYVPVVSGVSPAGGPATGGSTVTITGAGFVAPSTVTFGGKSATAITVVKSTEITVKAPAGSGAVPVTVTSSGKTSPVTASTTFTYAPVVTKVTPPSGPQAGATAVTITGIGFNGATTVKFGSVASASFTVASTTKIVATSPTATTSGVVDVTVGNKGGSSVTSTADQFNYEATPMPVLSLSVVPAATGVFAGNPVQYKVTFGNTGTATATGTTFVDSLPSGPSVHWSIKTAPSGSRAPTCTITSAGIALSCTSVNLGAGVSYTFEIQSTTANPATCGTGSTALTDSATLGASNVGSPVKKIAKIVVACAGTAKGRVVAPTATHPTTASFDIAVTGASVALCPTPVVFPTQTCKSTTTTKTGYFSMSGLPAGTYFLEVLSLDGRVKTSSLVHIFSNSTTTIATTKMPTPLKRMPSTVSITTPLGTVTGTTAATTTTVKGYVPPVIPAKELATIREKAACTSATGTFVVQQGATTVASGTLVETPPGSTTYVAHFTPGTTSIGAVVIKTTFTCPGNSTKVAITFTAYIDPSGQVLDSNGQPLAHVVVTLYKLTTAHGSFVQVPTGSAIMSPTNRRNPQLTGANGTFDWFVEAGTYQIIASYNSCTAKSQTLQVNGTNAAKNTVLTGLRLTLSCPSGSGGGGGGTTRHHVTTRPGGKTSPGTGATTPGGFGYLLVSAGGGVFAFGEARFEGSLPGIHLSPAAPIVGVAPLRTGGGYWLVGADGGVFSFGSAHFYGSLPVLHVKPAGPVSGMAAMPTGLGYWLVSSEGDVYSFGAAKSYGSPASSGAKPGSPIVGMAAMPTGKGYWLAAADGDVYAYGTAPYLGGISTLRLRHTLVGPIVDIAGTPTGKGYWLAGKDGGVFAFGTAPFFGNTYTAGVANHLRGAIAGITPTPDGQGYWLIGADGGVFAFGDAPFLGNTYTNGVEPRLTGPVNGRSDSRLRAPAHRVAHHRSAA